MDFKIDDILEGEIVDFSHEGNGVLKQDNIIVFVDGGVIGDRVSVKINEVKKSFATATLLKILKPSKDREILDFKIEEARGSIPLAEYKYEKQLEWKKNKVKMDLLKVAGLDNVKIHDTIGSKSPFKYRNHVQIPVGTSKGKTIMGFYNLNSHLIVDMKSSIIQPEICDNIMNIVRRWMDDFGIKAYSKKDKTGFVRHLGIRVNKDNEAMVIIVTGNRNLPKKDELVQRLLKENVVSIYENINTLNSGTYGRDYKKLYGKEQLLDYIGEYKFKLSPNSFFQVNRNQAQSLYDTAIKYLDLNKNDIVYDLYCGIGTISLNVANKAKEVIGIEIVKEAIEDAKTNAKLNNVSNIEFLVGKAEELFPKLMEKGTNANKIVLDPPRKGCEKEVMEAIVTMNPERIVYVSCNSTTMARDIKILLENGYKVEEVQPVDMFSHTAHVETVCLLSRKDK